MSRVSPSLDQRRARHAWLAIENAKKLPAPAEYAREAKRLPVRIKISGLGQAIAFLNSKASDSHDDARNALLSDLGDWLLARRGLSESPKTGIGRSSIMAAIVESDARFLRLATDEAMLYLQWLTRFAEADIPQDED